MLGGTGTVGMGRRVGRVGCLLGEGGGTGGGLLLLLREQSRGLLRGGHGTVLVALQALAELREAGVKLAAAAPTRSRAATSWRASNWLGPAPGTRPGIPTPDSAAFTSTSTQAVNCAHANHTMTVSALMNVLTEISRWSQSIRGAPCGSGHPTLTASAPGTPTSSTSRATNAPSAFTKSPNVLRRRGRGCGVRFLGLGEVPVELEVVRRAMAGVPGSCEEAVRSGGGPSLLRS